MIWTERTVVANGRMSRAHTQHWIMIDWDCGEHEQVAVEMVRAERGARLAICEHAERVGMFEARLGDLGGHVERMLQAQGTAGELDPLQA